jgi:hypothetical protein
MTCTVGCKPGASERQVPLERFSYGCHQFINEPTEDLCIWEPHLPPPGRMLLDLHFRRKSDGEMVASEPTSRVLPSEISAVQAVGGRVEYIFNVPILRVEIDRDQIPRFVRSPNGVVTYASTPADPRITELGVRLFFSRPARVSDAKVIEHLGGRVWAKPDPVNDGRPMIDACVPDKGIPRVRALPGLDFLRPGGVERCSEYSTFEDGLANKERRTPIPSRPKMLDTRLEMRAKARVGQSVPITLVVRNVHEHTMQLRAQEPTFFFLVTAPNGDVISDFQGRPSLGSFRTWNLRPGQTVTFRAVWDQRDSRGRPVPPGTYSVRGGLFRSNLYSSPTGSLRIVP